MHTVALADAPYQGAGACTVSTGAQYQVHLGS